MRDLAASTAHGLYSTPRILREDRPDGRILLRSAEPLGAYPPTLVHSLASWAATDPDHVLVAERQDGGWREVGYGEAKRAATAIGQGLLDAGLGPDKPLMILSGNSVDHLLLTLGAFTAGVPVAPVSVAYSLQSNDHARLRDLSELISPGGVWADDEEAFGPALDALGGLPRLRIGDLRATAPAAEVETAAGGLGPDSLAKILFTSGSTGRPKGVLTTHRMLSSNQQMIRQAWPFLTAERPAIVDWLPWSHTFGGSHNVGMMIANGGTLHIDDGRPAPGLFDRTLANLRDVPPTIYFNVPAGYAHLVPALEADADLAGRFFSRLRLLFNAAAALPSALRERLTAVAERTTGTPIPITGSWGLTETAPAATSAHFEFTEARSIGVPLPGVDVLLVSAGEAAYELRVRGPMLTPGYFARPDLSAECLDDEGFFKTGDAVELADPDDADKGLLFRGRLAEDFRLTTGTFVRVGAVRTTLLSVAPLLADAVVVGENRDEVCALAWLNQAEVRPLLGREPVVVGELVVDEELTGHLTRALAKHGSAQGSAGRVERLLVMSRPAELDLGEITDKGYVNQRQVQANRADLVEMLYADPLPEGTVVRGR